MFRVFISNLAENDIEQAYQWWAENRSATQATQWYGSILQAIATLRSMPERCPLASESAEIQIPIHQLLFGIGRGRATHRILFRIAGDIVVILRVLHVALGDLPADLGLGG